MDVLTNNQLYSLLQFSNVVTRKWTQHWPQGTAPISAEYKQNLRGDKPRIVAPHALSLRHAAALYIPFSVAMLFFPHRLVWYWNSGSWIPAGHTKYMRNGGFFVCQHYFKTIHKICDTEHHGWVISIWTFRRPKISLEPGYAEIWFYSVTPGKWRAVKLSRYSAGLQAGRSGF
jgi:hypothetical protein